MLYMLGWLECMFGMGLKDDLMFLMDEEVELKKRGYNFGIFIGEGLYVKVKSVYLEKN